ncbi:hypothetical protein ACFE04_020297 [Oxalis oulophora]
MPMTLYSLLAQYDELKQGKTYICTTKVLLIDDKYPWCYLGCKLCTRGVEHHETTYWCKVCGVADGTLSRYRVKLDVVDGHSSAFFLLFESIVRSVFGHAKDSAISLDDIFEDELEMTQSLNNCGKVKRPLVYESDDDQDEPQPKKLTRYITQ